MSEVQEKAEDGQGFAIASLVLGIISIIRFCQPFVLPCAILALVFGLIAKKKKQNGMATAGIILGAISLIIDAVIVALIVISMIFGWNFSSYSGRFNFSCGDHEIAPRQRYQIEHLEGQAEHIHQNALELQEKVDQMRHKIEMKINRDMNISAQP